MKRSTEIVMVACLLWVATAAWTFWPHQKPAVGVVTPLPPAKEAKHVKKAPVHPKSVMAYPDKLKADMRMPAPVAHDPNEKLITTGHLSADARPYTLMTTLNTETGESTISARPDPLPWLAPGRRGAVGVAYGLQDGKPTAQLYGYHDLLQVKSLYAGVRGEVDQHAQWFAGGYVEFRF